VTAAAPGQAAYEAWHAKLAEHHPVVLALRKPQPWDLLSAEVRAEWEAAATAAVAAYIELNGADPVDARAVIAEALAPQPYDVTWATGLAAREPDAADGVLLSDYLRQRGRPGVAAMVEEAERAAREPGAAGGLPELRWAPYQEFGIPDPAAETHEPPAVAVTVGATGYRGNDIIVYWTTGATPWTSWPT
jgi:hypothetical protein